MDFQNITLMDAELTDCVGFSIQKEWLPPLTSMEKPGMCRVCSGYLPPIFRLGNQVNVDDCLQKFEKCTKNQLLLLR